MPLVEYRGTARKKDAERNDRMVAIDGDNHRSPTFVTLKMTEFFVRELEDLRKYIDNEKYDIEVRRDPESRWNSGVQKIVSFSRCNPAGLRQCHDFLKSHRPLIPRLQPRTLKASQVIVPAKSTIPVPCRGRKFHPITAIQRVRRSPTPLECIERGGLRPQAASV